MRTITKIVVLFLIVISTSVQATDQEGILLSGTAPEIFNTKLGHLKNQMLLLNNNIVGLDEATNQLTVKFGYAYWDRGMAFSLKGIVPINIGDIPIEPPKELKITFVKDVDTDQWLATDGHLCTESNQFYLLEGHTVTIMGGKNGPVKIGDKSFAETTVVIRKGRPVEIAEAKSTLQRTNDIPENKEQQKLLETGRAELVYAIGPDDLVYITNVNQKSGYREVLILPNGKYTIGDIKPAIGEVGFTFVLAADFYKD